MKSGLSLPIGSTNQKDKILTPQGNRPKVLLPYSMQNGSGTMDITQGIVGTKVIPILVMEHPGKVLLGLKEAVVIISGININ